MSASSWLEIIFFLALLAVSTPLLGDYMAKIYQGGKAPGDRFFLPIENLCYRVCRVNPKSEQRWRTYVMSLLAYTLVSGVLTYAVLRLQGHLPGNPDHLSDVPQGVSFNTAISFMTNTNWQNYGGESTMSQLSQMFGLVLHQFISAAVGMALAAAFIRALVRRRQTTLGNFWVDTVRTIVRVLIPISFVFAIVFMSQGVTQDFSASTHVTTLAAVTTHETGATVLQQNVPGGPVASMAPIEALGDNGGGYFNANFAHPIENPNGITNIFILWLLCMVPFAFAWTFGRMIKSMRQGWVVLSAMSILFVVSILIVVPLENRGNVHLKPAGVTQVVSADNPGGNLEGKDIRIGATGSALNAAAITATSTGGVNSALDSYTPTGGAVPLFNMMLGEVIPGGTGTGLYGMLIFVIIGVFIGSLMVGRTPMYLGKQILAKDMKLAAIYILVLPVTVLVFASISVLVPSTASSIAATGAPGTTAAAHGLTEVVYAYTSAAHNNGSAFGGFNGNTLWYNITLSIAMWVGRFFEIIPALALAGSLVRKRTYALTSGTLRTDSPLFVVMLMGIVIILVGLTYFPALALGPLAEQFSGHFGF